MYGDENLSYWSRFSSHAVRFLSWKLVQCKSFKSSQSSHDILRYISSRWYFALISISGLFSVTFSVVYAYVADVTDEHSRGAAYGKWSWSGILISIGHILLGLVTATFAASLITSPAIGAHLARLYSENFIIALGLFILLLQSFQWKCSFRHDCRSTRFIICLLRCTRIITRTITYR